MRTYGRYNVTLPDEKYVWEPDEISVGEQLMIENETGGSYHEWIRAIVEERAVAIQTLIWYLRRMSGRQEDRMGTEFPIRKLEIERIEDEVDPDPEADAGSEPAT